MANFITEEQFITWNDKVKQYIQDKLDETTKQDKLVIAKLNQTIEQLQRRIDDLEAEQDNLTSYPAIPNMSRSIMMPMALSEDDLYSDYNSMYNENSGISLMSIYPDTITVQEDIQEDYVVYDRVISPNENKVYKNIVVTTDNKSNRVFFSMWYTFDDRELENKEISIIWLNALGNKGESLCVDKQLIGDRLYFAWNIPGLATVKAGTIKYAIRITSNDYAWHTLPAEIECVQGLMDDGWDDKKEAEKTPGWVDYIEGKYKSNLLIISESEYRSITPPSDNTLYVVNMNDGTINMYVGSNQIHTGGGGGGGTTGIANIKQLSSAEYNDLGDDKDLNTLYLLTD